MKITDNAKVTTSTIQFEYSRFDTSRTGNFYAKCSFKELTPNLIFVYDIEPIQFLKPSWIPTCILVSIKNRKTTDAIGTDQALNLIDVFLDSKGCCNCESRLFDFKRPDLRIALQNASPINLLLQC